MRRQKWISLILILCFSQTFLFQGCTSTKSIKPFETGANVQASTEVEERLWAQAKRLDESIRKSGQIYKNEPLRNYLQGVIERLYPEFKGKIRLELLKDPVLNAFAMPNGSIYVNIGLIAALENEAQIATVLAHEGIHFTRKHGALQRENFHSSVGFGMAVSLLGVPFIGQLIAVSSIFGYSQEHELEADKLGLKRLIKAGYDAGEAPKTFEHLLLEAKANKVEEPFFFSTHPALQKRIDHFKTLIKETTQKDPQKSGSIYNSHVGNLRDYVLKAKIKSGRYDSIIAVLSNDHLKTLYSEHSPFYLGEAYRLRGQKDDRKKAIDTYLIVEQRFPEFAPVYKSLGMLYYKNKDYSKARSSFEKYIELNPAGKDLEFIRHYIKNANQKEGIQ